ncbi:hypothetical protein OAE19_09065 [Porticoccaceae bacterium]|nr:hypothetical protein [Porticoccaceae bacterium]
MISNNEWLPDGHDFPSDDVIEHERLIQEIRLAESRRKSFDEQGDDNSASSAFFDVMGLELELEEFYKQQPEFDPRNMRWSKEFRDIGIDPYIKPRFDWLKKSTWTTLEAINLLGGYRPERPESLFEGSQKINLEFLAADMFVKIHPVNPNVEPENYRFKPSEFVTWLSKTVPGSVPDPFIALSTLGRSGVGNDTVSKQAEWRKTQRGAHREAIKFAMNRWPGECEGKRGKITGDAIADAVDCHWGEISRNIEMKHSKLSSRIVANLARQILRVKITD